MILVSCLRDTERLGADHGQPRVSTEQIRPALGRRPKRPLTGPGAGSRRRARKEGGRYPGAPRAEPGCRASMRRLSEEGQHPPWSGQAPGPLPLLRGWVTHREVTAGGRGAAVPAGSPRTRFTRPARGRGSPGRRPRIPTPPRQPIRVVTGHELPPQGLSGVGGGGCGVTGFQLRRPGDPGDKSLQPAARLQCESHPPRHLLQQPRSGKEGTN